jgi:hypothetical protein
MADTDTSRDYLGFEANGVEYLHNLEHFQNCLFYAKLDSKEDSKFRISRISFNSPTLSFEKNKNRLIEFTGSSMPEEVTITWIEDAYRTVEKFHMKWLRSWYDFEGDFIMLGQLGKFKNLTISAYHYINKNNALSAPLMDAEEVVQFTLENCVPTNMGNSSIEFDWSQGGIKEFTTTYKFSKIIIAERNSNASTVSESTKNGDLYKYSGDISLSGKRSKNDPNGYFVKPEDAWSGQDGKGKEGKYPYTFETKADDDYKAAVKAYEEKLSEAEATAKPSDVAPVTETKKDDTENTSATA